MVGAAVTLCPRVWGAVTVPSLQIRAWRNGTIRMKRPWPVIMYWPATSVKVLKKKGKVILSHGCRSAGPECNPGSVDYEATAVNTQPRHSVF